jgi:N,N'-diacetyllegionaminate synthase
MDHTFIIAEIGVNHNADLSLAYRLIDEAAAPGADAVKFQAAIPELGATQYAQKAGYQKKTMALDESQLDMIRKIHFPLDVYTELKSYCEKKDIMFFSSAFDLTSLKFLEELGQKYHKVPSGEITNLPFFASNGWVRASCDSVYRNVKSRRYRSSS